MVRRRVGGGDQVDDLEEAVAALCTGATLRHQDALRHVPGAAGLYAFHGDGAAWSALGLPAADETQPLYVGKAETSLRSRDVGTHFAAGRTGSSTVRRSLAALLDGDLDLVPVPRNLARPDRSANFALDGASEERLSEWMRTHLSLATWSARPDTHLDGLETAVLRRLQPPLNLAKVGAPRGELRSARRRMADRARAWRHDSTR